MSYKIVSLAQNAVTLSSNQSSSMEFIQDLALRAGSDSFFVADLGMIDSLVNQWFTSLPRVRPFYALNCNSDEMLVRIMASYPQVGFHCTTRQNLDFILDVASPDRLFYSNPCWTRNTLINAQASNVVLLGFDTEADLTRMSKNGITNKLILNIRMSSEVDSVTGCDVASAPKLLQLAADFGLDCVGVGFNLCSQRLGLFDSIIECAAQLFAIGRSMGLNMKVLSLGDGFPSLLSQQTPTFAQICEQLNASLNYYIPPSEDIEIIATPGGFFAASVFSLATRIVAKSEVNASEITDDDFDAGQRAFIYKINEGYYGAFGCSIMPNCEPKCQPLFTGSTDSCPPELFYGSVLGPVDEKFDVVQKQCQIRQMCVGEWLIWPELGSYSLNNWDSLDDNDRCNTPEIYYFSKENDWKFAEDSAKLVGAYSSTLSEADERFDVENELNEDNASEPDADPFWMFDWPIV